MVHNERNEVTVHGHPYDYQLKMNNIYMKFCSNKIILRALDDPTYISVSAISLSLR